MQRSSIEMAQGSLGPWCMPERQIGVEEIFGPA
jgi:hypothetical protein